MNHLVKTTCLLLTALLAGACASDTDEGLEDLLNTWNNSQTQNTQSQNTSGSDTQSDDLSSLDVAFDETALVESETIPTSELDEAYEDYVEHSTFDTFLSIVYSSGSVSVSGSADGVTVSTDGADVVVRSSAKNIAYVLSGASSDGSFKIYSDKKFKLTLNGLDLTNPTGAAINVQSSKRVFVELSAGSSNKLTDGSSYTTTDGEDEKGTFFSEGQLIFSGSGTLNLNGNYKHALVSDDYIRFRPGNVINITVSQGNGVKANDAIVVDGGVLNVSASGTAAKGLSSDGYLEINGGRTTVITTGGGEYDSDENDASAAAGIKSDSTLTLNGGEVYLKSTGAGGKGISCDQDIVVNDGTVKIITTGKQYAYTSDITSSPKGIKGDANVSIYGGNITIKTTGGEGSEGLESKATLTISGGQVVVYSYDDAINASQAINLTGGSTYAYSTNNDGIDSNGTLKISGGVVIANGTTQPESGIDSDSNSQMTLTGGTVVSIGGGNNYPTNPSQPVVVYGGSFASGTYLSLNTSDGKNLLTYALPRSCTSILLSSASMSTGNSYVIGSGGTLTGGTTWMHLTTGASLTGYTTLQTVSLSSNLAVIGTSGGNMGGGGFPGR